MQGMPLFQWYLRLPALPSTELTNNNFELGESMRKVFCGLAISVFIMFVLPWLAVTFVKGDGGMAVCFLLFYAVNPIYSVIIGVFAGRNVRTLWSLPIFCAVFFLLGTWAFFDMGETAFILYASVYLVLGIAAMLFSAIVRKKM